MPVVTASSGMGFNNMDDFGYIFDVRVELDKAELKFPPFRSAHEGYAIIKEELDELWECVKSADKNWDAMYTEATQVSAMALRFMKLAAEQLAKEKNASRT